MTNRKVLRRKRSSEKPIQGEVRRTKEYKEILADLKEEQSVKEALSLIAELMDTIEEEIYGPIRYDEITGQPTKYAWKRNLNTKTKSKIRVYIEEGFNPNIKLHPKVLSYFKTIMRRHISVVIELSGEPKQTYIVQSFESESNPGHMGGRGDIVTAGIIMEKTRQFHTDFSAYTEHKARKRK